MWATTTAFIVVSHVAVAIAEVDVSQRHVDKCTFGANSLISLDAPSNSRCCAAVEVYLARRTGGYCPSFDSSLSFGVRCLTDPEFNSSYVPDKATVQAAAHEICAIAGCSKAVHDLYQDKRMNELNLPAAPNCHIVGKQDGHKYVLSVKKTAIAGAMFFATLLLIFIGHKKLTPKWIANSMARARAAAHARRSEIVRSPKAASVGVSRISNGKTAQSAARTASRASTVQAVKDVATIDDEDTADQVAQPEAPEVRDRPESPELIDVIIEDDVIVSCPDTVTTEVKVPCSPLSLQAPDVPNDSALDIDALSTRPQPERKASDPIALLLTARSRCKAHFGLFRCLSIVIALGRVGFAASSAKREDLLFFVVALFSVYQVLVVLGQGMPDFSQEHAMHGCCVAMRDLRGFAYSTLIVEISVLFSVAVGAVVEGDFFLVQQASLDLVLVRLYVAWLALGLRRHIIALTFAVVPEEEELSESGCRVKDVDQSESALATEPHSAFDALVPAWPALEDDFVTPAKGMKKLKLWWRVLLLVAPTLLVVGALGIWMVMSKETEKEELSSCRTAMRGVDFCVPTEFLGQPVDVNSIDECCQSCDAALGCSAWTFQETDDSGLGRCWRLKFTEAPCEQRPGKLECRCHTSADRHGGFKPTKGDIIWHDGQD